MERVKEANITIKNLFDEALKELEKMLKDALEDFRKNGCNNEDAVAAIQIVICEGNLEAYARVAKELFGDESLEEKYLNTIKKYANDILKILFGNEK